jgi:phosphonate transport system ATP-binding protein
MLVVEGLTCRFGTKAAVDNASFSIAPGGFVGVIGRSGAGKSTLLRMLNRLAEPSEGRIWFEGVESRRCAAKISGNGARARR